MGKTLTLSKFVEEIYFDDLPSEVINMTKRCIYDYLGCSIFATQTEMGKIMRETCIEGNFGKSTIFPAFEDRYDASFAALANGTFAHGFEIDDINLASVSHPGAVVISAALALAQERGASGKTLIEAIVAGYEVMARVGSTVSSAHVDYGHHPTASHGTFGAAAAAAKIMHLSSEQIAWAFGIAGSLASGLMQFSISGTMVKRIHAGKAAQQGVIVAKLAEKGFTGPTDILEGKYGYCKVYRGTLAEDEVNLDAIDADLGKNYAIMDTAVKPSPACGCLHSVIDCVQEIRRKPGFNIDKIEKIVVLGHHNLVEFHNDYTPDSILAAQYSLPFTVGLCLACDIEDAGIYLDEEVLHNERAIALGKLVIPQFDEAINDLFPDKFGGGVEFHMSDGTVLKHTVSAQRGSADNPFTDEEVTRKFKKLATSVISERQVDEIQARVDSLEQITDIGSLFELM